MRHGVKGRKLGRISSHREALFRNQLQSLVDKERIITTLPKAKELRPIAEKVITRGKQGTVHARRWVLAWMPNSEKRRTMVKKVFDDIAPRFEERPGGYLRIVKLGPRQGDGAEMAVLELVEREGSEAAAAPAPDTKKAAKKPEKKAAKPAAEAPGKEKKEPRQKDETPRKPAKDAGKKATRVPKSQKGGGA